MYTMYALIQGLKGKIYKASRIFYRHLRLRIKNVSGLLLISGSFVSVVTLIYKRYKVMDNFHSIKTDSFHKVDNFDNFDNFHSFPEHLTVMIS